MADKHHTIEGIIDPEYGNYMRIVAKGSNLEDVLREFAEKARFVANHTEEQLLEFKKRGHSLLQTDDG